MSNKNNVLRISEALHVWRVEHLSPTGSAYAIRVPVRIRTDEVVFEVYDQSQHHLATGRLMSGVTSVISGMGYRRDADWTFSIMFPADIYSLDRIYVHESAPQIVNVLVTIDQSVWSQAGGTMEEAGETHFGERVPPTPPPPTPPATKTPRAKAPAAKKKAK